MSPRELELAELLGAYALDAVDAAERVEIDEYLQRSPRARAEVSEHLQVAALLGGAAGEAPPAIWDRIDALLPMGHDESDGVSPAPFTKTNAAAPPLASVTALDDRRRLRRMMLSVVASAAAAAAVIGLGIANVRQDRLIKDYKAELAASRAGALRVNDLLAAPGTKVATLRNDAGQPIARVILASSGEGYLVDSGLPHLSEGRTYQLWGVENGLVLSLGVLADSDRPIPLAARGEWSKLVLTEETAPGVVTSAQPAVAAGIFTS
jgi:Anti-sigma-K factor rskA